MDEERKKNDKIKGCLKILQYLPDGEGRLKGELKETISYNQYWDIQVDYWENTLKDNLPKVLAGELSPVGLYALLFDMTDIELSRRTSLSRRKVRRHRTAAGFRKAAVRELIRYADVFDVPLAALFCFADPSLGEVEISVEEFQDGLVAVLKPGRQNNEWNFIQAPNRRAL
jgi:hypothetical protein